MQIDLNQTQHTAGPEPEPQPAHPHTTRVPVPFLSEPVGLGDVISRATKALGMQECSPCQKRRERMNRLLTLSPWET